jgi:pyruvate dehydrogenase E1 component
MRRQQLMAAAIELALSDGAESITVAALAQLADLGEVKSKLVREAINKYRIDDVSAADAGNTEGSG